MSLSSPVPGTSRHTRQMQRSIMSRESRLVESAGQERVWPQVTGTQRVPHAAGRLPVLAGPAVRSPVLSLCSTPLFSGRLLKSSSTRCEATGSACPDEGSCFSPVQDPTPLSDNTLTLAWILPYLCTSIIHSFFQVLNFVPEIFKLGSFT